MSAPEAAPPPYESNDTPTIRTIGRYRLVYELASGGMATVYLACAQGPKGFDKVVALKRIHPHLAKERAYVDMFLDEARLAARVAHPNVGSVLDFGEEDGEHYLVMDYLVGEPLSHLIRAVGKDPNRISGRRWVAVVVKLLADACEGLHAAHELRDAGGSLLEVVHRDVSPQNLMVGYDGVLRVVDFGIARAADRVTMTGTGQVKGKWGYMAPEQIGRANVDRRTDVWALGVVLWETLTLRRLFRRGSPPETAMAVVNAEVQPPSAFNRSVTPELDRVVMRALARDLSERTPDARTLGRELRRATATLTDDPVDAPAVAALLGELFPGQEARKRQLAELARRRDSAVPKVAMRPTEDPSGFSGVREASFAPARSNKLKIVAALATLIGAVAGGYTAAMYLPAEDDVEPAAVLLPTADQARAVAPTPEGAGPAAETPEGAEAPEGAANAEPESAGAETAETRDGDDSPETQVAEPAARPRPAPRRRGRTPAQQSAPTAAPTPTPLPPAGPGRVTIVTQGGWARVFERGRELGVTPLNRELAAGRHVLELRWLGQPPGERVTVEVQAGQTTRVRRQRP